MLRHPAFLAGQADTSLLDGYDLAGLAPAEEACRLSATAAALAGAAANRAAARAAAGLPAGWRNVVSQPQRASFDGPRGRIEVAYLWQRDGITVVPAPGAPAGEPAAGEPPRPPSRRRPDVIAVAAEAAPRATRCSRSPGCATGLTLPGPAAWSGWTPPSAASR